MNWPVLVCYQLPVFIVFGLFGVDRYRHRSRVARGQWLLDGSVALLSASRTVMWFLPLSGHALFLTYAIGTSTSKMVRAIALLVMIEAVVIKHFWLHDDLTPWVGMVVGITMVLIYRYAGRTRR